MLVRFFLSLGILLLLFPAPLRSDELIWPQSQGQISMKELREIALLEGGRKKPLDTFARETVRTITGREYFHGWDPVELLFSWLTRTPEWELLPIVSLEYRPLAQQWGLTLVEGRVAPKSLRENGEYQLYLQTVQVKKKDGEKLDSAEQEALRLADRLQRYYGLAEGSTLTVYPRTEGGWESLAQLFARYPALSLDKAPATPEARVTAGFQGLLTAYYRGEAALFLEVAPLVKDLLQRQGEKLGVYPSSNALKREVLFNQLRPFHWSWVGYTLAGFLLLLSFAVNSSWPYRAGVFVFLAAFALHTYGFILRIWISGRAPVTNMYETVLWIPYGTVLFALILEAVYKSRFFLLAASAMATLGLIVADSAPSVLDPSIQPLVPVLRSNFWLTIHVLTITLSYGAFTLALGVANINLGFYLFRPANSAKLNAMNFFIYRAIQIGVVLLAAGTILGGVWANESWGRFWGWDPKEVWALIALLGYLALLHGRYVGWVRGFGLSVGAVVSYLLVLMAWYGVNFVLGVGLHSYGFSSGGAKFVSVFVALELLWILVAAIRYRGGRSTPTIISSTSV